MKYLLFLRKNAFPPGGGFKLDAGVARGVEAEHCLSSPRSGMSLKRTARAIWKKTVLAVFACTVLVAFGLAVFTLAEWKSRGEFRPRHPGRVRFALCQYGSRVGDFVWNAAHALEYAEEAVRCGADVIVLPEYSFTTVHDLRAGRAWINLEEVPWLGKALGNFTRRHRCYLFANHARTFGKHRRRRVNESFLVGPDGKVVARYAKRFLALLDQRIDFDPGTNGAVVAELPFARVGMLICKDTGYSESFREAFRDADLLLMQFGHIAHWGSGTAPTGLRASLAGATNVFPRVAEDWAEDHDGKPFLMVNKTGLEKEFAFAGGSRVFGADEKPLAVADSSESILYVDFPLDAAGRIDAARATVPENPTDRVKGGFARDLRTTLRRLAESIPEPPDGDGEGPDG
jgi:predicted amidohydrolase